MTLWRHGLGGVAALLTLLSGSAAWAVPSGEQGVGLPRDISTHGHLIDSGLAFGNVAVTLLFIMVVIWLAIAYFVHDEKHKAKYDHGSTKRAAWVVAGFTLVIFMVVDGHHFYASVVELDEVFWNWEKADGPDSLRVEVNARQWAWEFRYPGPDGRFATDDDIVRLNDLRVPADRPVVLQMRAVDVVHSLYIPNVRVKTDVIPGTTTKVWFQVDKQRLADTGSREFAISCAQHCGTWHYKMKATLTAYADPADFAAWQVEAAINAKLDHPALATQEELDEGTGLAPKYGPAWGWDWEQI